MPGTGLTGQATRRPRPDTWNELIGQFQRPIRMKFGTREKGLRFRLPNQRFHRMCGTGEDVRAGQLTIEAKAEDLNDMFHGVEVGQTMMATNGLWYDIVDLDPEDPRFPIGAVREGCDPDEDLDYFPLSFFHHGGD